LSIYKKIIWTKVIPCHLCYVDYGGIFRKEKAEIKKVMASLASYIVVKDLGEMEAFVGCKILNNKEKDTVYIHQPNLVTHLKQV
jgi:hypothetical protein